MYTKLGDNAFGERGGGVAVRKYLGKEKGKKRNDGIISRVIIHESFRLSLLGYHSHTSTDKTLN